MKTAVKQACTLNDAEREAAWNLVAKEGRLLDLRDWDAWLDLYLEDAEFWIPCWKDEYQLTANPKTEISLIYYSGRAGLEDRVFRIRTERSLASTPLPRTSHLSTVNLIESGPDGSIRVESNWATFSNMQDQAHYFFGNQLHVLKPVSGELKIQKRKIVVMNDTIPNVLDIYSV